jgi:hypothetical protein
MAVNMRIPGQKRSQEPDDVGNRAGMFAEAVRDGNMDLAWSMLSRETRGMRMGVWATRNNINMQDAYQAGYNPSHAMRASMMADFRTTVLSLWPLEDLTDLGVAPTNYIDDEHAFVFLPFGVTQDNDRVHERRMMSGLVIPMRREDGQWQVDLPSWRFLNVGEQPG